MSGSFGKFFGSILAAALILTAPAIYAQVTEAGGAAVFEAENFTSNLSPRTNHHWDLVTTVTSHSGAGYMEGLPNNAVPAFHNADSNSPELQFSVNFTSAGTHYVWIRGYGISGNDNSIFVGIDGGSSVAMTLTQDNIWQWSNAVQGGGIASFNVAATGNHTVNLWMREDGMRIDRVALFTDPNFSPTLGNVVHIPNNAEPAGVTSMRTPLSVTAGANVTIYSRNQYQGTGGAGNQLQTGSTVFYKKSTDSTWSSVAMTFYSQANNNIYYSAVIPGTAFALGDTIQYYLKIPYSDHFTTFVYGTDAQSNTTETESVAQAAPFSFVIQDLGFWQSQNIYQVFTDRFFDGDPSNNNAEGNFNATASTSVHGGDLKGIEQKLDYIKSLGATAIWISPVVKNTDGQYHGYAGRDFYAVAPQMGTILQLQQMVQAAHAKGLLVVNDVVVNHGGNLIDSGDSGYPNYKASGYNLRYRNNSKQFPAPFNISATNPTPGSLFHNFGNIQNFGNTAQVETGELSSLDDFRTELAYVRTNMAAIYNFWIDQAGFDGFRIDTVKHVEHGFWDYWCQQIHQHAASIGKPNFFMFGEVLDGSEAKVGSYTGRKNGGGFELDSELDYPLYFKINSALATATGNTKQIEDHYNAIAANYDPVAQMRLVTFLDNHDQRRFLNSSNANNNVARLNVALAFLYTARGVPCLYYGTEQGFNGGADPSNREDMFAGGWEPGASVGDNFNMAHPLFQLVAKLNNFRRLYPALSLGTHVNLWNNPNGPGLFAYARRLGNQEVFVVFNTAGSTQTLPARSTIYPTGTVLVNLLNPAEVITIASAQTPAISVPATTAKIFIAQSQMQPLDPVVTSISPAHDASNVATSAPLVIHFSKAMDTTTVEAAFSTTPATTGTFAWSPAHDIVTYTPGGAGWPGSTLVTAQLAASASDATAGKQFYAAFSARFKTAASTFSDTVAPVLALNSPQDGSTISDVSGISGNASDNIAVEHVEVQLDGGDWNTVMGAASWSFNLNTTNFLNGSHLISARAIDTSGNISAVQTRQVRFFNIPGAYVQRISAGNNANATDCNGFLWVKDQPYSLGSFGFTVGTSGSIANNITGACPAEQTIYQRERYSAPNSTVRCLFDCPPGLYQVTLLEAETFATGPNQRVFNVFLEGQQILSSFDIYAVTGGPNIAWSQSFNTTAADARLEIQFSPLTGNSRISGIEVHKTGDLFSDTDGIADWWRLAYFDHAVGQDGDNSRAGDDADGDGITNLDEYRAGTNPLDPTSAFVIAAIEILGADIQVTWKAIEGRTYQLQRASSPEVAAMWSDVGSPLTAGGPTAGQIDPGAAADILHFYRVIVP